MPSAPFKWEIHCPFCGQFLNRWKILPTDWKRRWSRAENKWVLDPVSKFESDLEQFERSVVSDHLHVCSCDVDANERLVTMYKL